MKKSALILSSVLLGLSLTAGVAALPAHAETGSVTIDSNDMEVVLPFNYEQYLPLTAPTDVAVNDDYLAVSDNNIIYVFDKEEGVYRAYEHLINSDTRLNTVSCLEFSVDGLLYFTDSSTSLYILDCANMTSYPTYLSCSVFTLSNDLLYYATVTAGMVSISEINTTIITGGGAVTDAKLIRQISTTATPAMAINGETLYFAVGNLLYSTQNESIIKLPAGGNIQSLGFSGGTPYYTDSMGTFYHYNIATEETLESYSSAYSAFGKFNDSFYIIDGKSVLLYECKASAFADYEICSSSMGNGRLRQATDFVLSGNYLVIADRGNKRVSLCDLNTGKATPFESAVEPDLIATTEDKILVSNGTAIAVYDFEGECLLTEASFSGVIMGAEGVYGNFYLVTGNNYHYRVNTSLEVEEVYKTLDNTAKGLTSDVDGNLYVLYTNGNVGRYTEDDYMSASGAGKTVCRFPTTVTKLFSDFGGKLYAMYGNTLYSSEQNSSEVDTYQFVPDHSVYGTGYSVVSYAISYDSRTLYLLCGDFIVSTDALTFETLNTISVDGADEEVFSMEATEATLYRTSKNAVFILFDMSKLRNAAYFTFDSYIRMTEEKKVACLGETEKYYVVAMFNDDKKEYVSCLVRKENCTALAKDSYFLETEDFEEGLAYVSNDVNLYKYPFLSDSLILLSNPNNPASQIVLNKNDTVTVLGMVDFGGAAFNYYQVEYTLEGKEYTGYIPVSFLLSFDGTTPPQSQMTLTYLTPSGTSILLASEDGQTLLISNRTQVEAYGDLQNDETVTIVYRQDGVIYTATVSSSLLESATANNWRVMLIGLLIGVALLIAIDYFVLTRRGE